MMIILLNCSYIIFLLVIFSTLLCSTPLSHSSHRVHVDSITVIPGAADKTTKEADEKPYEVVRTYIKAKEFYEKVMNDRKVKDKKNKRAEQTMLPGSKLTQNIAVTVLLGAITVGNVPQRKSSIEKIDKKVFLINISPIDGMRFDCGVPSDPTFLPFKMNSEKIRERIQKGKEKEREKEIEREREREVEREKGKEKQAKGIVNVEVKIKGNAPEENKGSVNLPGASSDLRLLKESVWVETIKYDDEVVDKKGGGDLEENKGREEEVEVEVGKGKGRGEERQWEQKHGDNQDNQNNQHSSDSVTAAAAVTVIGFAAPGETRTALERERESALDNSADITQNEVESELMDLEEIIDSAIKKKEQKEKEKEKVREGHSVRCLDVDLGLCIPTSSPSSSSSPRKNM
jgi:hypothetical protein